MARKIFSINTTAPRTNLVLPGHDQPDYVETVESEVDIILGDGTVQTVTVQDPASEFDQTNQLNENCINLGIDYSADRQYFSCRTEIDITNLGGADADALEWREETYPLSNTVSFLLLDSLTPDEPDDAWDNYKVIVEGCIPRSLRFGNANTGIERVDEMGYTINQSFKDKLIQDWNRANTVFETANTESANTGA